MFKIYTTIIIIAILIVCGIVYIHDNKYPDKWKLIKTGMTRKELAILMAPERLWGFEIKGIDWCGRNDGWLYKWEVSVKYDRDYDEKVDDNGYKISDIRIMKYRKY